MLCVIEEKREERKNRKHKLCCCLWLFLCVFLFWLMTVCFCDWCCLLIVDGFDRQTEMSKCCVCCVLMVFFVSFFFHFVKWIDEFCGRWKKRREGKARKWLIATKDVFCWLLLNWLIDSFFFEMDWKERIFWLFLIYE